MAASSSPSPVPRNSNAVTIITCTKRRECMRSLLANYSRQNLKNKELILLLNNDSLNMKEYIEAAKSYPNVRVYRIPGHVSLGSCLNIGVQLAKYGLIAKFDDDDYYARGYLKESLRSMRKTNADIVGKRAHHMYLKGKKMLLLRYPELGNQYVSMVQGATLLIKRRVFKKVSFPDVTSGECVTFCSASRAQGFTIYSGSKYNFLAIRRRNSRNHTWIVSDKSLLARNVKVLKVKDVQIYPAELKK